eukprot:m.118043 g.118043  ORF g.118043 m.118043 type:complete len:378 (+) comp15559_c0_seq2:130-1263(+)
MASSSFQKFYEACLEGSLAEVKATMAKASPKQLKALLRQYHTPPFQFRLTETMHLTALHAAALAGHLRIAQLLIQAGAALDSSEWKMTPLHLACRNGHPAVVKLLLTHHAVVDAMSEDFGTPLSEACESGHLSCAKALIAHGADVMAAPSSGCTPLFKAFCPKTAKLLLDNGAEVNYTNKSGVTALYVAARGQTLDVVKVLVDAGSDLESGSAGTLLEDLLWWHASSNPKLFSILTSRGANVMAMFYRANWHAQGMLPQRPFLRSALEGHQRWYKQHDWSLEEDEWRAESAAFACQEEIQASVQWAVLTTLTDGVALEDAIGAMVKWGYRVHLAQCRASLEFGYAGQFAQIPSPPRRHVPEVVPVEKVDWSLRITWV